MNRTMLKVAVPLIWLLMAVFDTGAQNAYLRHHFYKSDQIPSNARSDFAFSVGWSLVGGPIAFIITPFTTEFYHYGWEYTNNPWTCESPDPVIWCKDDDEGNKDE